MFPIFALLPLLAVVDRRWLWATVALSDRRVHQPARHPDHRHLWLAQRGQPAVRRPVPFVAWRHRRRRAEPWRVCLHRLADAARSARRIRSVRRRAPPPTSRSATTTAFAEDLAPAPGSVWQRVTHFAGMVSVRRDRSATLVGESGGRLDRRDVALMLLFFLAALLLRTYRLEVPFGPHFDEVYHARTAKEFLQDWQYGMPHSIYEFTHPHLAKYAMAVGIMALGDNRVTSTVDLGMPVLSAVDRDTLEPGRPARPTRWRLAVRRDPRQRARVRPRHPAAEGDGHRQLRSAGGRPGRARPLPGRRRGPGLAAAHEPSSTSSAPIPRRPASWRRRRWRG